MFATLQETSIRDRPVISMENYIIYCYDADERKVVVGIDATAKIGLEQQSYVPRIWHYPAERTSCNGDHVVDFCEQTSLIIASTFKRNHRLHQLMRQGSFFLTPEGQREDEDYQTSARLNSDEEHSSVEHPKYRAVWDIVFDSHHRLVLLSFKTYMR
ncbi:hypothetical protein RB195_025533 [Necator americanus]|uniref:Uncharacterized protein n=1 Tax=Necator americanus TaxID=51031 RepID=A0ABR1ESX2_NECAM